MNNSNIFLKAVFTSVFLFAAILCGFSTQVSSVKYYIDSNIPCVLVSVGDYQVKFATNYSWTYREVNFKNKKVITPTGAHQPVLKERTVPVGVDNFLGTGHRPEQIELVEVLVLDNEGNVLQTHSVDNSLDLTGNNDYIFHKKSKFYSDVSGLYYLHDSKITITKSRIKEEYFFEAVADDYSNIDFMYAFMHCFDKSATKWYAGDNTGITDHGEFLSDDSFTLRKDIRFCLVHDLEQQIGISIIYPTIYMGRGIKNAFWNRVRDNKHYLLVDPLKVKGDRFFYSAEIKVFDAVNHDDFMNKSNNILNNDIFTSVYEIQKFEDQMKVRIENRRALISNVEDGDILYLMDVSGRLYDSQVAYNNQVTFHIDKTGAYIIKSMINSKHLKILIC